MIYHAVFNSELKEPDAIFKKRRWAENFIRNQKWLWKEIKYSIWEVEIPRTSRKKLVMNKQAGWFQYVTEGLKLLLNKIKNK